MIVAFYDKLTASPFSHSRLCETVSKLKFSGKLRGYSGNKFPDAGGIDHPQINCGGLSMTGLIRLRE